MADTQQPPTDPRRPTDPVLASMYDLTEAIKALTTATQAQTAAASVRQAQAAGVNQSFGGGRGGLFGGAASSIFGNRKATGFKAIASAVFGGGNLKQRVGRAYRGGKAIVSGMGGKGKAAQRIGGIMGAGAAIALLGKAAYETGKRINEWADKQAEWARQLAYASPAIAMAYNQADVHKMFREMRQGQKLGESTRQLTEAQQRAADQSEPLESWWQEKKNAVARTWFEFKEQGFKMGNWLFKDDEPDKGDEDKKLNERAVAIAQSSDKKLETIIEQLKIANEADKKGGATFGMIVDALAKKGKDAAEQGRKRVKDVKEGNPRGFDGAGADGKGPW